MKLKPLQASKSLEVTIKEVERKIEEGDNFQELYDKYKMPARFR